MSEQLIIQSHKGPYSVIFDDMLLSGLDRFLDISPHFIIDANIARLYGNNFRSVLDHPNTIIIEATEESKSLEKTIPVFERLVQNRVRRGHNLVAIGGGVVQDITCFVASTLLRGLSWYFVPTTLLAQADSCIGSKSSINLGATKNILGTFNPPESIYINTGFLKTLENKDIRSGVGEILKVHAIEGVDAFNRLAADYDKLFYEPSILKKYIRSALLIKQRFIEVDEFDRGIRNIFNYGHSFGHAIESATGFIVPHGIAVTMGMDMANRIAVLRKLLPEDHYYRMHQVLRKNYENFVNIKIPLDSLLAALMKDKKNTSTKLVLILSLGNDARIERVQIDADDGFRAQCRELFSGMAG